MTENILRMAVFLSTLLIPISLETRQQKAGFILYLIGVLVYFASWVMQIYFPHSPWSLSVFGFTAPAYTTMIWFTGIGLMGTELFIKVPYHYSLYIVFAAVFVFIHTTHAYLVYRQL